MKKLIFFAALSLLVGATLVELIRRDTGYVLIKIGTNTIEMSFWVAISALIIFALSVIFIWKLIKRTFKSVNGSIHFISSRRYKYSEQKFNQGLIHYIEGNWAAARKELLASANTSFNPLINYLAAARSAFEMGDNDATQAILHQAEKNAPTNSLAIVISQARIQLQDKKYEQCLATLERVDIKDQNNPVIIDLKRQTLWHLKDWDELLKLLPKIKKNVINYDLTAFEESIHTERFKSLSQKLTTENSEEIHTLWHVIPKNIRAKRSLIIAFANQLFRLRTHSARSEELSEFIKIALSKEWIDELVYIYGRIQVKDNTRQLSMAEHWLKNRQQNAILLHSLGKLCITNTLWGKAKDYLEASLAIEENPELYADLAQLMRDMHEEEKSHIFYEKGLKLSLLDVAP